MKLEHNEAEVTATALENGIHWLGEFGDFKMIYDNNEEVGNAYTETYPSGDVLYMLTYLTDDLSISVQGSLIEKSDEAKQEMIDCIDTLKPVK